MYSYNNIIMVNSIFSVKFGVVVGVGKKFGAKSTQKLCWFNTKYSVMVGVGLSLILPFKKYIYNSLFWNTASKSALLMCSLSLIMQNGSQIV